MDHLQHPQLVVPPVHSKAEEKASIALVNHTQIFILNEVAHLGLPLQDHGGELSGYFLLFLGLLCLIPLLQPELALPAEEEDEVDHGASADVPLCDLAAAM